MNKSPQQRAQINRILLVESQSDLQSQFLELVNNENYQVTCMDNALDAIEWIKKNEVPKLLIIEEKSSPLDGFQTFNYLRIELDLALPVLISRKINSKSDVYVERDSLGFIDRPYTDNSAIQLKTFLAKYENLNVIPHNGYSLKYLKELSDNNEEFIALSLNIFRESVTKKLLEINDSLAKKEFDNIREVAHNIKPSFSMLSSEEGTQLCDRIVYDVKEPDIPQLVEQLNCLFVDLKNQLNNDFPIYNEG